MLPVSNPSAQSSWFPGFDWLRTFFILFVVCMHLCSMQTLAGTCESVTVFDVIQFNVFCTAVPGFLLISHFLLLQKTHSYSGFRKRILDFVYLYVFWVAAWVLVTKSTPEHSVKGLVEFILRGGGWAYYYFSVLLINSLLCMGLHRLATKYIIIGLLLTAMCVVFLFLHLASEHLWMTTFTYWWPVCFIALPFLSCLLSRYVNQIMNSQRLWTYMIIVSVATAVSLTFMEWQFSGPAGKLALRPFLPDYLRISLSLSAFAIVIGSLKITYAPRVIKFISKNSLGIFCTHVFVLRGVYRGVEHWIHTQVIAIILSAIIVLILAAFTSEILRFLLKQRVI
jgi:hypothetical protein